MNNDFDLEDDFNDELDLVKLVSTDANDLNQYLVFKGSNTEWYGINVSKVEEVMVYDKNIDMAHNNDKSSIIYGTADIRNNMITLIYYDDWYDNPRLDDNEYELIILANYGGHKLGIIVSEVANIVTIENHKMSDNSQSNTKTTFIAKINIEGNEQICTIFDGDKMLLDIFDDEEQNSASVFSQELRNTLANKMVYFADDSKFVRALVEDLFKKLKMQYEIFTDGSFLLEYLQTNSDKNVDLFITDLEMPNMGGREVITKIRQNHKYDDISILVHTNMSNNVMDEELSQIGANGVISKMNMVNLGEAMIKELN